MLQKVRHYLEHFLWKEKLSDYTFMLDCVKLALEKRYYLTKRWIIKIRVPIFKSTVWRI